MSILKNLKSYRKGIAYVLDTLYLAPTLRSPAERTMRDCRGENFAMRENSGFSEEEFSEPTSSELSNIVEEYYDEVSGSLGSMGENDLGVVFQGPGDPLEACDVVIDTVRSISRNGISFRVNTLGLCDSNITETLISSDVVAKGDQDQRRETRISKVSVFLPASDPKMYDELIRPKKSQGFQKACSFIAQLADAGIHVECTAVDRPDVRVSEIEKLCLGLGALDFRIRPYFP